MRTFNYSAIREQKWDSDVLGLIAAIYKEAGKQELYLKQRPEELEKLVEIAKIQSTEASNAIEGIPTWGNRPVITSCQCVRHRFRVCRHIFIQKFAIFWFFINSFQNTAQCS